MNIWAASFTLWMRMARKSSMLHTMRGGKQTETLNTIGLHRGYTGHEMLSEFDIINMNGRLYDPILQVLQPGQLCSDAGQQPELQPVQLLFE
ncbi:hypothetical protein ABVC73_13125 [Prevotella melaninogenica]